MGKKQAVLLIHGIGEQRPMDTLRGFVEEVWDKDTKVHNIHVAGYEGKGKRWSKPDGISGNYELRCLTTGSNANDKLTDFYEFYWAHLMQGNELNHVFSWLKRILFKAPWNLPKPLVGIWLFLLLCGAGSFWLVYSIALSGGALFSGANGWMLGIGVVFLLYLLLSIFENIVGDAARYLDPSPKNIKRRQEIRAKGIEILKKLHESKEYDRIIIVGHSLGTFIAYDILTYAWQDYKNVVPKDIPLPELDKMEELIRSEKTDTQAYRQQQSKVFKEQLDHGSTWLISDLITLGSPLTYADLLLAENKEKLLQKQQERELPTSPPQLDEKGKISYGVKTRKLHYAAVFASVRWTNIYFPPFMTVFGDVISGPLQPMFGYGIEDLETKTKINGGLASHTQYWTGAKGELAADHILKLRKALNLLDK